MVLVISLVLLLSLTLLGLAAMQNTSLEERMAGNMRAENIAFQAAEAGLRAGEAWLAEQGNLPQGEVDNNCAGAPPKVWAVGSAGDATADPPVPVSGPYTAIADLAGDLAWWFQWLPKEPDRSDDLWAKCGIIADLPLVYVAGRGEGDDAIKQQVLGKGDDPRLPRYVIEESGYERDHLVIGQQRDLFTSRYRYQITARGLDQGRRGEVLLQSSYARRF
jgi:type IV pilus assembly protein PilX